ncbi:hypothetical protein CR513_41037, partial [Mucuna pruriens]
MDDYHKEMEMAMIRANILEDQEEPMASFLNGLNHDIADVGEMYQYVELQEMNNSKKEVVGSHPKVMDLKKNQIEVNPSKNQNIKCFKFLGRGHIASQCPNKRTMIMKDNGEVKTKEESNNDLMSSLDDDNEELPHEGDLLIDFQDVFQDEVPSGLPPIRGELSTTLILS